MNATPKFEYEHLDKFNEVIIKSNIFFLSRFHKFLNKYHPELNNYFSITFNTNSHLVFNYNGFEIPNLIQEIKNLFNEFVKDYDKYVEEFVKDDNKEVQPKPYPNVESANHWYFATFSLYDNHCTFVIDTKFVHLVDNMEMFPYVIRTEISDYMSNIDVKYVDVTIDPLWNNAKFMYFNELYEMVENFVKEKSNMAIWEEALEEMENI